MLVDLSGVLGEQHKSLELEAPLTSGRFSVGGREYPVIAGKPVNIAVEHIKDRRLSVQGGTELTLEIPCDRCLEPVSVEFEIAFDRKVDLDEPGAGQEDSDDLDEANYIDGNHLDVDKLLYNEILIGWPEKVLCREDCRGICNVCGQNLNTGTCDCEDTGLDPRMAAVRDIFKNCKEV